MTGYFSKLLELLKLEKEEDSRAFLASSKSTTLAEKRAAGLAWYPVSIKGQELTRGDYLVVELERPTHRDTIHQLRFGASAELFSASSPDSYRLEGVISHSSGDRLKLTLRTDELPEWAHQGKLGVNLLFDTNSYKEMEAALKQASTIYNQPVTDSSTRLVNILTGQAQPESMLAITKNDPGLNQVQNLALRKTLEANDLAIIHGPPGTGKTRTLVRAIAATIAFNQEQVLVVAPSNTAVDLLAESLAACGLNVVRIGNPVRVADHLLELTLDARMADHPEMKQVKVLKKRAAEFKNLAHKYKRQFGRAEQEQRKALFSAAHDLLKETDRIEAYVLRSVLDKAQVITATLHGSNHYTIRDLRFRTVFIDEAAQALEPACWIPILKAVKVIFAGDPSQLSPTLKSSQASKAGLGTTLMEKAMALNPASVVLLEEQYRMNAKIMRYSSQVFYSGRLKANSAVFDQVVYKGDLPFVFIDTAGCGFAEKTQGTSTSNPEEGRFLMEHLNTYVAELNLLVTGPFPTIAVVSPYKEQITELKNILESYEILSQHSYDISVNTIDSFQGQERDIVYISLVRSNTEGEIGFLADIRRMNVAMTRARKKLVIIGDGSTLSSNAFYAGLIDYAAGLDAWQSAWEFIT